MTAQPTIDNAERRRRLAVRHHLAPSARVTDIAQVAGDLVGVHATDPASVYLGFLARMRMLTHDDVARALYDDRSVLKILGMRRTMFVVPRDLAGTINVGATRAIASGERKRLLQMVENAGVDRDVTRWISTVEKETLDVLEELGEATAAQLTKRVPGLRVQVSFGEGRKWAGKVGVSTRMLFLLAAEGRIVRGRPKGSWLSSMYAWTPMDRWLGKPLDEPPIDDAQAELVRRWLRTFGPGTQRDIQWWTGWTVATTRKAIAAVGGVEVEIEDGPGLALPDDLEPTAGGEPWVALLPALDTTTMGWFERSWYMGDQVKRLFDRNGNAGPTIWVDGRVVGGWAQRRNGEVAYQLLEDIGREAVGRIDAAAGHIQEWLGNSRVIPRFRTPLEMDLV